MVIYTWRCDPEIFFGGEVRALDMLSKHSTTQLHPHNSLIGYYQKKTDEMFF
jgi:hypothetical protein